MRTDQQMHPGLRGSSKWRNSFRLSSDGQPYAESFSGGERDCLFVSQAGRRFVDLSSVSGADSPGDGRGFAYLDYDRDGWLDLAAVNANTPCLNLLHNQLGDGRLASARFLVVELVGGNRAAQPEAGWSTRDGYGARISVRAGDQTWHREHRCGEGFAAQNTARLFVGIGARESVDELAVRWPSGRRQQAGPIAAGSLVRVYENTAEAPAGAREGVLVSAYVRPAAEPASRSPTAGAAGTPPADEPVSRRFAPAAVESAEPAAPLRLYTSMATWCPACRRHLPQLGELRAGLPPERLAMYGLPVDPADTPEMLAAYVAKREPAYELVAEFAQPERARFAELLRAHRLPAEQLPSTIVTDAAGNVLWAEAGVPSLSRLRQLLARRAP